MRAHDACSLGAAARHRPPSHHRCQPDYELRDRGGVARRAGRVPQPEQGALDGVRARLEAVVAGRGAAASGACSSEQGADDQAAGLGRQRLASRSVPAAGGDRVQRHRQRQRRAAQSSSRASRRSRRSWKASAEARDRSPPSQGRWRSIRYAATVRSRCICGLRREARQSRNGRQRPPNETGRPPGLRRSGAGRDGGPRQRRGSEEHRPPHEEQPAPQLLPMPLRRPANRGFPMRVASHPSNEKAAAQTPNSVSAAAALTSGDGGN